MSRRGRGRPSDSKNVPYSTVLVKYRFIVICTVESAPFVVSMYRPHFRSAPFLVSEKEKWGRCPQPPKTDSLYTVATVV